MPRPDLAGIHHLKIPVTDLRRSLPWYEQVFGYTVVLEVTDDDGVVRGVGGEIPGLAGTKLALRQNPTLAAAMTGFDPVAFAVEDQAAVRAWAEHLDRLGIAHTPLIEGKTGWLIALTDPDGINLVIYSWTAPAESGSRATTASAAQS
ncbi:VOC family protein [Nocardia nepalensis]|uniref:VOC family protein n=1 Tax=Nocardia nepalensis TaxID=3375448 RepID=UPI003B685B3E